MDARDLKAFVEDCLDRPEERLNVGAFLKLDNNVMLHSFLLWRMRRQGAVYRIYNSV
jgi:transcription-repair coupling factor (superfamily II helicase)